MSSRLVDVSLRPVGTPTQRGDGAVRHIPLSPRLDTICDACRRDSGWHDDGCPRAARDAVIARWFLSIPDEALGAVRVWFEHLEERGGSR